MKRFWSLFWITLALKLIVGVVLPLTPDEAYYWRWSYHLDWSYFDHPINIALLYWFGRPFEFLGSAIRWPGIILGHISILAWLWALKDFFRSNREKEFFLLLSLICPLTGLGSLLVTPDIPMMFFYALLVGAWWRWLQKPAISWAACIGIFLGLGFISKYLIVVFGLVALVQIIFLFRDRGLVFLKHLPLVIVLSLLASSPFWIWNIQNDFISWHFQLDHGLGSSIWKPRWTWQYLGGLFLFLFPTTIYVSIKERLKESPYIGLFVWVPLAFFLFASFKGKVEANWPVMAVPPFLWLMTVWREKYPRMIMIPTYLWLFLTLTVVSAWFFVPKETLAKTRMGELMLYEQLANEVKDIKPLFGRTYQMASVLSFELKTPINKLKGYQRKDMYDFWPESDPGNEEFYIVLLNEDELPVGYNVISERKLQGPYRLVQLKRL